VAELKTKKTDASVQAFLDAVEHPARREDSYAILEMMREITGAEPAMWGASIVGFDTYHYRYASGQEGEWPVVGFSPRKRYLTLYIMSGFDAYDDLLSQLGKYKTGKACLYINKLADVDQETLRELIRQSVDHVRATHA
jgi:hypothetical protein